MPAESFRSESYAVYSTDISRDHKTVDCDQKSLDSGTSLSIAYQEHDCMDPANIPEHRNGQVITYSPVPSVTMTDKWGSYWSKRERCCCFWNFLLTVGLTVVIVVIILVTKGLVFCSTNQINKALVTERITSVKPTNLSSSCQVQATPPKICMDETCVQSSSEILSKVNFSVNPCEDFYTYACGGFLKKTRLSWNSPRKRTNPDVLLEKHYIKLTESVSKDIETTDSEEVQVIKTLFQSCVDHSGTQLSQVQEIIESLGGLNYNDTAEARKTVTLTSLLAEAMTKYGVSPLFTVQVQESGKIGVFNRFSDELYQKKLKAGKLLPGYKYFTPSDYFYRNEETDAEFLTYKSYIADLLAYMIGINETEKIGQRFVSMIDNIYHINVYIKRVFFTDDTTDASDEITKCNKKISLDYLQDNYNYNISWRSLFNNLFKNSPFLHNYTLCSVALSKNLIDVLSGFSFSTIKQYIIFQVLSESDISLLLPSKTPTYEKTSVTYGALFGNECAHLSEQCCIRQISRHIPMYYMIVNHTSDKVNDALERLFTDLISSIERIIRDLYWIPIKQKQYFFKELQGIAMRLEWKASGDKSFMHILRNVTHNYFQNMQLMVKYSTEKLLCGQVMFKDQTKDSSILSMKNKALEIPISALEVEFLPALAIPNIWMASMGTYISEAIAQLFDIEALLRFLTEEKIDHRVALTIAFRLQCLLDEYKKYPLLDDNERVHYVRGDLTKSANFQDSLSLRVVYNTYLKWKQDNSTRYNLPGIDLTQDQLFFVSYAQSMCEKTSPRGVRKFYVDTEEEHQSPGKYRVLGTLSHFKKFADAFNCPLNTTMNPREKCSFF